MSGTKGQSESTVPPNLNQYLSPDFENICQNQNGQLKGRLKRANCSN